jgi:CRP-like cAMP-binding protein
MASRRPPETILPKELAPADREALIDALYAVQRDVFAGVDRASFAKYVVESKAERTWIRVHRDAQGQIGGYAALHAFERRVQGRAVLILRAEAGSRRDLRGGNANVGFLFSQILRAHLEDRARPLYYLGCLVHPSSYALIARFARTVWPSADRAVPAEIQSFMSALGDEFELPRVEGAGALVRQVGWITRDTEVEQSYWINCDKPAARFFVQQNRGYGEGHGLLTLVPIEAAALAEAARRMAMERAGRWAGAMMAQVHRLPIGAQLLRPAEIRRLLRGAALFSFMEDEHIDLLASSAEILSLPPGAFVFHENDFGDDLYLVARGAAYILKSRGGEPHLLDQLGVGAVFGEIALLSSDRRTASVRTATSCTLVRLNRNALVPILRQHPRLHQALWAAFAERYFDTLVASTSRLRSMTRAQRLAWFRTGQHQEIEEGGEARLPRCITIFLLRGQVEVQDQGTWMVLRAPAIIDSFSTMRVIAREAAYIVRLDDPIEDVLTMARTGD